MQRQSQINYFLIMAIACSCVLISCKKENGTYMFRVLDAAQTNLDFENRMVPTPAINMFKYMYFYNGAGVGAGDFNNDGLVDLFFAANQQRCELFLNAGSMAFKNVTSRSGISSVGWSTGVSVVDVNSDGLLDVYVCKANSFASNKIANQLWVNVGLKDGIPLFEEHAREYGVDFLGNSTQAAFFDYDIDGDLDMFLLNHAANHVGTFGERYRFTNTYSDIAGDRFFRNEHGKFVDVTRKSGINSSAIGFGLGVVVTDIDSDGWPDFYVGNDFHENDYLYLNQKDGTFKDLSGQYFMHTSMYTMGVDAADFNNDGLVDVASVDMLPDDPHMIRRSLGEDDYDIYFQKIRSGYDYQYTRNNLQLNRGNKVFSEIGCYAGVQATDWSWGALWVDFDNDGWKDLFVSNGIPKRMNDIDYVNFVSNDEIQEKLRLDKIEQKDLALVSKFPEIKLFNKFFQNNKNLLFNDVSKRVKDASKTFSNGAVYADLDNDGDQDIVTNNIDDQVSVYQNMTREQSSQNHYLSIKLVGSSSNNNAIGAKLFLYAGGLMQMVEVSPVRGFLSSMVGNVVFGSTASWVDSLRVVWPDQRTQFLRGFPMDTAISVGEQPNLPVYRGAHLSTEFSKSILVTDLTKNVGVAIRHDENTFPEFTRELLMPKMMSSEGPALAIADIDHNGTQDVFLGSSKTSSPVVLLQKSEGSFVAIAQQALINDETNEEVSACWTDVNSDNHLDLVVVNGGNEFFGNDEHLQPCVYLNDGHGLLQKKANSFDSVFLNASVVVSSDFDDDGKQDLFIGGRSLPWEYGSSPKSFLLKNDGTGVFSDVSDQFMPELRGIGMVTGAAWIDMDRDGDQDLLLCEDWGGVSYFRNESGHFSKVVVTDKKGWWNFVLPFDVDGDGDMDVIAGNQGLNSRLNPTALEPVRLYLNDFDGNGRKEQLVSYYLGGKEIPFMGKGDLQKILPSLKKKFLYAEKFAQASLQEMFSHEQLSNAKVLTADYFANSVILNDGHGKFETIPLPAEAQWSALKCGAILNADNRGVLVGLFGNFYQNNIQLGRNDADFGGGTYFTKDGKMVYVNLSIPLKGQVRHVGVISELPTKRLMLAMNNDSLKVIGVNFQKAGK